ncbi:hypothetical protein Gogos_012845, partial [Gossypium gossypioides]|nr:hypothetical protein [Gossypium gossypioides]
MLRGKDNSDFGWDEHRQMVVAEDVGKDAQTTTDIVEKIDVEDVSNTKNPKEGNIYHGCEDGVFLDEMDVSATQLQ